MTRALCGQQRARKERVTSATAAHLSLLWGVAALAYDVPLLDDAGRWGTFAWVAVLGVLAGTVLGVAVSSFVGSTRAAGAGIPAFAVVLQYFSGVFVVFGELPGGAAGGLLSFR